MSRKLTVSASFWLDHADRFAGHPDLCRQIGIRGDYARIECEPQQLAFLKADAEFYADPDATDCGRSLRRAAAATLFAIKTVEG